MMMLRVDPASAVPPYEQVRRQLAEQIESGALADGSRLPPVRRLAEELGLAVNTVARTYRELEAAGLVVTRGRNGTVVAAGQTSLPSPEATRLTESYLAAMARLGFDGDAAAGYIRRSAADPTA
jgi:GntR family transcriptional regulator